MPLEEEFLELYNKSRTKGVMLFVKNNNIYAFDGHMLTHFFPCSTSKIGFGNEINSYMTPTGLFRIAEKIGDGQPIGMRFIGRKLAGMAHINRRQAEVESKVLTRIMWLSGLEKDNSNTIKRYIYIHGSPNEWAVGTPITRGCICMKNNQVIELFNLVTVGTLVYIFGE